MRAASLGADQRLRETSSVGHMRHVEVALVDDIFKMLAAILAYVETAGLRIGIVIEHVLRATIYSGACGFHV